MTVPEILDLSLGIYRAMGWTLLRASAVPAILCLGSFTFVFRYVLPALATTSNPKDIGIQLVEALSTLGIAVLVGGPLFFIGASYAGVLIAQLVGDHIVGSVPNIEAARRSALRLIWPVSVLSFRECVASVVGLLVSALSLMASALVTSVSPDSAWPILFSLTAVFALIAGLVVFPIILGLYALAIPAAVHEGLSAGAAARRGRQLLKRAAYQPSGADAVVAAVGIALLLILLVYGGIEGTFALFGVREKIAALGSTVVWRPVLQGAAGSVSLFATLWLILPVWCTTVTVLYFERRIRLEGYDIEALAKDIWRADRHSRFEL